MFFDIHLNPILMYIKAIFRCISKMHLDVYQTKNDSPIIYKMNKI